MNLTEKKLGVLTSAELEAKRTLEVKARFRLHREFIENPYMIPFKPTNRRVVVPFPVLDEYKRSENLLPIKKTKEETEEEFFQLISTPFPVVAFDNCLKEEQGLSSVDMNYATISPRSFENATIVYFKGMRFIVLEYHEVIGFVNKDDLSLMTREFSKEELEIQKKIEDESKIQRETASV